MQDQDIRAYVDKESSNILEDLYILLRYPSVCPDEEGVRQCASFVHSMLEDAGVAVKAFETGGSPIIYGYYDEGASRTLLVYGHYDVQPPGPLSFWDSSPFEPSLRDGYIFCRGVADNKGQLFAHIVAIKALLASRGKIGCNLKFLFEGEEEIGSPHLEGFIRSHKEMLAADAAFTADALQHVNGQPFILPGLKGGLTLELFCKGPKVECHGAMADIVPNPLWRIVHALGSMRSPEGNVEVRGFYDHVLSLSEREKELLQLAPNPAEEIRESLGLRTLLPEAEKNFHEARTKPTFNISLLTDGHVGPLPRPTLPTEAKAMLRINLVPNQDPQDIADKIRKHLNTRGFKDVRTRVRGKTPPSMTSVDHPFVCFVTELAREVFQREPLLYPRVVGSGPDYCFTQILGLPSVFVPYAGGNSETHGPNENMSLQAFFEGIFYSAALFSRFSECLFVGREDRYEPETS